MNQHLRTHVHADPPRSPMCACAWWAAARAGRQCFMNVTILLSGRRTGNLLRPPLSYFIFLLLGLVGRNARQGSFGMREEEERKRKKGRKEAEITNSQQTVTANRDDKMGWAGRGQRAALLERGKERDTGRFIQAGKTNPLHFPPQPHKRTCKIEFANLRARWAFGRPVSRY